MGNTKTPEFALDLCILRVNSRLGALTRESSAFADETRYFLYRRRRDVGRFAREIATRGFALVKISAVTSDNISPQTPHDTSHSSTSWNNFVAASPYGDVMQCLEWGEVKRPDWQPIPLAIEDNDNFKATALVLKRVLPRTGRSILYVPRGPILDWNDRETARAIVNKLRALARAHRAILIKIDPAVPSSTRFGGASLDATLRELGFQPSPDASGGFGGTQPRCVMKTDISGASLEEVQARFHQKWRYNIRLSAKKGVTVKSDCTRDDIKIFHELYATTAKRDGFVGRPLKYFEQMLDVLEPQGLAKLFLTYLGDKPLSGAICFLLPPQCWYVYGASSNEERKVMPNHAMQWAMMQWARDNNCTIYDFRGVADEAKSSDKNPVPDDKSSTGNEDKTPSPALSIEEEKGVQSEVDGGKSEVKTDAKADNHLQGLNRFKEGFGAELVDYIGEYDLVLSPSWYYIWTNARPKIVAALKKRRKS